MGFTAAGISTSTVTTDAQAPLGFVMTAPCATANGGMCEWVYVFNDDAASFTEGTAIYRDPSATTYDWYGGLLTTAVVSRPYVIGIAQHTIAATTDTHNSSLGHAGTAIGAGAIGTAFINCVG